MTGHELPDAASQTGTAAVEARIAGKVQGVGYRYFAFEAARRMGVVGYVRNTRDGGVRVYGEGPRETLEQFLQTLAQGPRGSRVREMQVTWGNSTGSYSTFRIDPTL